MATKQGKFGSPIFLLLLISPPVKSPRFPRLLAIFTTGFLLTLLPVAHAGDGDGEGGGDGLTRDNVPTPGKVDKSQYNLFNPTPDNLLREFETSRPDQTTGPHTVDAGHFYLELGLFENSLNLGQTRTSSWVPLQGTHFRAGLTNTIELELIYDGFTNQNSQAVPATGGNRTDKTINGSGNLTVRMRFNVFGDDGGTPFVFAIIPQVNVPTATERIAPEHFEGSVILPVSFKLPAGFSTIVHAQPGSTRNPDNTKSVFEFISGATLYHNLFRKQDRVQLYLEYFDTLVTGVDSTLAQQVDVGVRWRPIENLQFDAGCNFGVSKDAPDYQWFSGVSTRF